MERQGQRDRETQERQAGSQTDAQARGSAIRESYQKFDPRAYLENNYTPPRADFSRPDSIVPWKLKCLREAFSQGDISGRTLIDIGSGPTVYQLLSACEFFPEIILTDYLEVNRQELQRWLRNEADAFDWTPYIQHACELEGKGSSAWPAKAARLRSVASQVIPVDVHCSNPLHPRVLAEPADCLLSCFCLEAVSPDRESFQQALRNVSSLLRPGGHCLLIGALDESFYLAGEGVRIPVVPVDQPFVSSSLQHCGFQILTFHTYTLPPSMKVGVDDVAGIFFVKAKKM
ncbi:phenylethanolamine N-methyltransferase [Polyodon spathula]|uniref:phenylethanolamine N-methyltransferase n=1 Tax=Polyodon spathula TaxID=7913 RepID=UPI001B7E1965|nr:phenylethanolamine N-methyltransferase [Polyodon spathula]